MSRSGSGESQFRDPWGLFRRMASSGDRTARWLLMYRALSMLVQPVDALLGFVEKRRKPGPASSDLPVILIIGSPRAGTTLMYQVLTHYLDVGYFDNLSAMFPRAPLLGRSMFRRPGGAGPARFRSYFGYSKGWHAPNDAFHVWNRWLGDHQYHSRQALSAAESEDMRRFFGRWLAASGKPLVNKNNRNADCVPLLAGVLDNAVFIEVSREPEYVVQSLLLARPTIQGRVEHGWGLDSEEVELGAKRETVIDSVCDQVTRIRQRLDGARAVVADDRYMRVRYEDLCAKPAAVVESVAAFVSQLELRPGADLSAAEPFPPRNEHRLPDSEIRYIRRRFGELV